MNQYRFVRATIYDLKRNFGVPLVLHTTVDSDVDLETGEKTVVRRTYQIRKAILLPKRIKRDFVYDLSFVAANKNFTYGGFFDKGIRTVIIDMRDYPAEYEVRPNDFAVIDHVRYNVKEAEQFDHRLAVLITLEETKGEETAAVIEQQLKHDLFLSQQADGELV